MNMYLILITLVNFFMFHLKLFWITLLLNEQAQLWSSNWTYEESLRLLDETNAAVEMHKHGGCSLDLSGVDLHLVSALSVVTSLTFPILPLWNHLKFGKIEG